MGPPNPLADTSPASRSQETAQANSPSLGLPSRHCYAKIDCLCTWLLHVALLARSTRRARLGQTEGLSLAYSR